MTLKEERELKKAAKLEAEKQRIEAMREYEEMYDTFSYICGIDEAGRGPLAGPVVAGVDTLIPLLVLLNIVIFISFSSSCIALVRLGCEIYNFSAASVIVPVCATVIAYFNC